MSEAEDIMAAANTWRSLLDSDDATNKDRRAFEAWTKADPRHLPAFQQANTLWRTIGDLDPDMLPAGFFKPSLYEKAYGLCVGIVRQVLRPSVGFGLAGAVAASVAGVVLFSSPADLPAKPAAVAFAPQPVVLETGLGEIRTEVLADATTITLGARSAVEVIWLENERRINLLRGDALFDVTRDVRRPFIVQSGDLITQVLGTVFEVQQRPRSIHIGVSEGKVEVSVPLQLGQFRSSKSRREDAASALRQTKVLTAGQQIIAFDTTGLSTVTEIDTETVGSWQKGMFHYKSALLADVISDAERYSDRVIVIADPAVADLRVTATVNAAQFETTLDVLSQAFPIAIDKQNTDKIVIRSIQ